MGVRFGFSSVPAWRCRGAIGVVLAAALLAQTFVATAEAQAAPPQTPAAPPQTPAAAPAARGADGTLQAPDIATARTIARLQGEKVEVIGERNETSSTWVMPGGTLTTGQAGAPIWVRQGDGDGTSAADWAPVDLTLRLDADGNVRPKAHPAGLVLAGEGIPEGDALVTVRGASGESVGLDWTAKLPAPRLEGPRAVYVAVQPGVDLVVEATRTGFEQFYVLTERPQAGRSPDLSLTVSGQGVTSAATADGGLEFTNSAGQIVGSGGTPLVWDAAVDKQRMHPVTAPWSAGDEAKTAALAPVPDWGGRPGGQRPAEGAAGPAAGAAPDRGAAAAGGQCERRDREPRAGRIGHGGRRRCERTTAAARGGRGGRPVASGGVVDAG